VQGNSEQLDRDAGYIRGRSLRVCDVVLNEIAQMPANPYSENVKQATLRLRDQVLPQFEKNAEHIVADLSEAEQTGNDEKRDQPREVDEMIDACQLVCDAMTDIRHALLMNRNPEDVDSDNEYKEGKTSKKIFFTLINSFFDRWASNSGCEQPNIRIGH